MFHQAPVLKRSGILVSVLKKKKYFIKILKMKKWRGHKNSETENGSSAIGMNDTVLETIFYGKAKYAQYGKKKNVQKWCLLLSKLADRSNVWTTWTGHDGVNTKWALPHQLSIIQHDLRHKLLSLCLIHVFYPIDFLLISLKGLKLVVQEAHFWTDWVIPQTNYLCRGNAKISENCWTVLTAAKEAYFFYWTHFV